MTLYPPSDPPRADGTDPVWLPWFAWYPVTVDAYRDSEMRNGKFSYSVLHALG